KAMQKDFPEVANYTRVEPIGPTITIYKPTDIKIGEQNGFAVENSFLDMFSYELLSGNRSTALIQPRSMILTRSLAKKMFSVDDHNLSSVIGKAITIQNDHTPFTVTGICEDVPKNSHLQFDFLTSYNSLYAGADSWKEAE